MMLCLGSEALEKLAGGDADPESRAHLDSCGACRAALHSLRDETNLLGDLRRALNADTGLARVVTDAPPGYTQLGLLARGGQGEILEALETASGRRVAIKLLVRGNLASEAQRARFLREIKLTSNLEHPGLVRVYTAGETPSGRPFLAMELVRGRHLDVWADEQRESSAGEPTRRILAVFLAVCEAVAYAHSRGVVHRDLKPSNILVDEEGRPKVLDLGLAKSLEPVPARKSTESLRTRTGEVLGTLAWMAPERLAGEADAGPRSDVYCLGLLLHRVVFGRPTLPLRAEGLAASSPLGKGNSALRSGSTKDSQLVAGCREILAQALALTPSERHADAGELAASIRALLDASPVRQRRRLRSQPAAVVLLLVSLATGFAWWAAGPRAKSPLAESGSELLDAVERSREQGAQAYEHFLDATDRLISEPSDEGGAWHPPEPGSSELSRWRIAASHVWRRFPARLRLAFDANVIWYLIQGPGASDSLWIMRGWENLSRIDLGSTPRWTELEFAARRAGTSIGYTQISRDERWMCISYKAGENWERDLVELGPTGATRLVRELGTASFVAWARTRNWCLVLGAEGGSVQVWDPERPEPLVLFELPSGSPPLAACFAEEDRELIVLDRSGRSFRFALPKGQPLGEGPTLPGTSEIHALGGGWILRLGVSHAAIHLETGRSQSFADVHRGARISVLEGPRVVANDGGQMRVWRSRQHSTELDDWVECETWKVSGATTSFTTLAAGRSVAAIDQRGVLTVRDLQASDLPRVLDRAKAGATLHDLEFSREEAGWIVSGGNEIVLRAGETPQPIPVTDAGDLVHCLAQGAPGQIVFGTHAGRVGYVETGGSRASRLLHQGPSSVTALDVDPSRRFAAWGDQLGSVYFQALDEGAPRYTTAIPSSPKRIPRLAFAPGGELIAGTVRDGRVFWWRPGFDPIPTGRGDESASHALAFHPLENKLVTGHYRDRLAIWDYDALAPSEVHLVSQDDDKSSIWALAFDPSGRFLAIGSGRRVTVWDWELRRTLFSAEEHDGKIFSLAFHPTLPILASAAELGELFEWDFRAADHLRDGAGARIQPAASLR